MHDLRQRTKAYALRVVNLVQSLPRDLTTDVLARQLLRCGTSVGANYRSACRAKSQADFIAKMSIVEEEADESVFWLELLVESGVLSQSRLADLIQEGNELVAIAVSSIRTARSSSNHNGHKELRERSIPYMDEPDSLELSDFIS
ncbi:MAG: four helix bundle protein [Chloroflexia bacterium]